MDGEVSKRFPDGAADEVCVLDNGPAPVTLDEVRPLDFRTVVRATHEGKLYVGTTRGRGRYDRDKLYDKPRKDVWLRPLRRNWKRILSR